MKSISITVVDDIEIGRKFDASAYPSAGLYLWIDDCQLVEVINGTVCFIGYIYNWNTLPSAQVELSATGGISENLFLKALAVAQNPELIREL